MAIDLTGANRYATDTSVGTTCTQIRVPVGYVVKILATADVYVFSGVDDGDSAPAAASRIEYTTAEMASGIAEPTAGPAGINSSNITYSEVGVAAKTGTVTVRASCYPPEYLR
jgi:hypothetical protein